MLNNDNLQPMGTQKFVCSEVVYQTEGSGSVSGLLTKLIDRMKRRNVGLVSLNFYSLFLFILMDYPIHIDTMSMDLSILLFEGSTV